jgi:hypothetical protein
MSSPPLPEDVRQFIERSLRSVEEIEVLRLLAENRSRSWSAADLGGELRTTASSAALRLASLRDLGFLQPEPGSGERFRFAPQSPEAESMALKVLSAYKDFPVTVVTLIFAKPAPSIQDFADAFRLKKEDDRG